MPAEGSIPPDVREQRTFRADRAVAALAAEQWGVLTTAELRACGLTRASITRRRARGHLHRLFTAVWAVGHPHPPWEGRLLAAVKACGPRALLSHYSAAEVWGFVDRLDRTPDVTIEAPAAHGRRGIHVHRTSRLEREDRRTRHGIPVTSPARTLIDLASMLDAPRVRAAIRRAQGSGRVTLRQIGLALDRYPGRRGSAVVREAVALGAAPTKSERESDVLDLILAAGIVQPDVNKPLVIDGRRLIPDFRWPDKKLILEVDSTAWHEDPIARADDRERQAILEGAGETVIRVHWRDAVLRPARTIDDLRFAGAPLERDRRGNSG